MKDKLTPETVYQEFSRAVEFNEGIHLYDCVRNNENFFIGKQWEGVQSNGLPTPVFNFLKRVVLFSVASVSTDNLKLHASPIPSSGVRTKIELDLICGILNDQFQSIFETNKMPSLIREFSRNAAVDGDGCTYTYWDESMKTGQDAKGGIRTEVLDNTQVHFGNPNSRALQSQPWILLSRRMLLSEAKRRAKTYGGESEEIRPDCKETGESGNLDELGGSKVTVLLRLWRDLESGTIHAYECTQTALIRKEWDLGIDLYPVTWMSWDYVKDCYHGQAMITGLIPNQIFVNKLFAMSMISLMTTAYPKVIYDSTRIKKWDSRVGAAIGMTGGDVASAAKIMDPATISPQISQFIELAIQYTQKFLGASDVALGDTRPDNTSAIIALQRASAVPMELTKQDLLQSIEDLGRIYLSFMKTHYGRRWVEVKNPATEERDLVTFDFSQLVHIPVSINLDVGASSYWSEIATMQTMDNLLMQNKIGIIEYLERVPAGMITDKERLIDALRRQQSALGAAMPAAGTPQGVAVPNIPADIPVGQGNGALQQEINRTGEVPGL